MRLCNLTTPKDFLGGLAERDEGNFKIFYIPWYDTGIVELHSVNSGRANELN